MKTQRLSAIVKSFLDAGGVSGIGFFCATSDATQLFTQNGCVANQMINLNGNIFAITLYNITKSVKRPTECVVPQLPPPPPPPFPTPDKLG